MKRLVTAVVLTLMLGCSSTNFLSKESTSDKADDGRRPSEQGEGVVGYLRDPGEVEYREDSGSVIVSAPAGVVQTIGGEVGGLPVCLQQVSRDAVRGIFEASSAFAGDDVKTLVDGSVNDDGSFSLQVGVDAIDLEQLIAVNVAGDCTGEAGKAWVPDTTSVVFRDPKDSAGFTKAVTYFPEFAVATDTICLKQNEDAGCEQEFTFKAVNTKGDSIPEVTASIWRLDGSTEPPPEEATTDAPLTADDAPVEDTSPTQKISLESGSTYWLKAEEVRVVFSADGYIDAEVFYADLAAWSKTLELAPVE